MSTFAVSIQAQIDALDAQLTAISPTSVGSDGTSITNPDWIALSNQRIKLESLLVKVSGSAPRFPRGFLTGLR
jgi:hypothetical protein